MKNNKISQAEIDSLNVKSAEDTYYNNNPQANKDIFDRFPEHIAGKYNAFIDYLSRNGEPVQSGDIVQMRIGPDGDLQVSTDGASWKNVVDTALAKKADKDAVYTKAEVDAAIGQKVEQLGAGDMAMIMYDANFNGVVDDAEKLGGNLPEYYATKAEVNSAQAKANSAMPVAGGTFTGAVTLAGAPTADLHPATKAYVDSHTANTSNPHSVTKSQVGLGNLTNNKQMPIAGGTFTGNAIAYETARTTRGIFNEETRASSTTGTLQSVKYFIDVT